ncbi:hypothetical protein POM88_018397 [Heracleum sosnowskyi]|uniref:Reverse transcriptase zinc-binding domain-containing protein n=1 Tax=Heracleum sosnowskyi TaxID=360622 RepID=A0AAD8IQG1_9APIA|nr:hypothetical protein POM88_018397 [Heracleum sosnowskyi]
MHLVAWEKLCKPKELGGLGLVSFESKNLALLGKWIGKWHSDRGKCWNIWLREVRSAPFMESQVSIYRSLDVTSVNTLFQAVPCDAGKKLNLSPVSVKINSVDGTKNELNHVAADGNSSSGTFFPLLARKCSHDVLKASKLGIRCQLYSQNFFWKLNNGNKILFWEDYWYDKGALKCIFPKLYSLSNLKEVEVSIFVDLWDCYEHDSNVFWKRKLRSWEFDEMVTLHSIVRTIKLNPSDDILKWTQSKCGYSVKEGVQILQDDSLNNRVDWEVIWKVKVPSKIHILWKLHRNVLPTKNFLFNRIGHSFGPQHLHPM